jgi:predicted ATPase
MIAGEAGIGKSRTLAMLAERARKLGFSVWQGSCYADAPAYWPLIEVLRAAHAELATQFHEHVPPDAWAMAHWLPELSPAAPRASDPSLLRFALFDELTRFLASLCQRNPRLIVLEDVHAADAPTLELIGHVASALSAQPLLIAASMREHELTRDDARARALQRCLRHVTYLQLQGLQAPEVADLVTQLGAASEDQGFDELLCERTQGNPFFIRQLLSLLQQQGRSLTCAQLRAAELPPAVRGVLAQRGC